MITVHDLSPNVEVLAGSGAAAAAPEVERAVATAWQAERARRPTLFDGTLFSVDRFSAARIAGRFVPYRYLVGQRARPELFESLRVRPLAVSGVLACADGIVFGRRAAGLTDDSGMWELVPSGGVDAQAADSSGRVDLRRQIMVELAEEVGLAPGDISATEFFCAVEDSVSHTIDIGIALSSPLAADAVRARHARAGHAEYPEIQIIAGDGIADFVAGLGDGLLAASRALLARRGLIPKIY